MRLSVDGLQFDLQVTPLCEFMLEKAGLDLRKAATILTKRDSRQQFSDVMQILAALAAHQYAVRHERVPTAQHWAALIVKDPHPYTAWCCVCVAVREALARDYPARAAIIN